MMLSPPAFLASALRLWVLVVTCVVWTSMPGAAQIRLMPDHQEAEPDLRTRVDTFLMLAVDMSGSITADERAFQRATYAAVLRDGEVAHAFTSGPRGRVMLAYYEWSTADNIALIVPPTLVQRPSDLDAIATRIAGAGQKAHGNGGDPTEVGAAMAQARGLLSDLPTRPDRIVLDISGDGIENSGPPSPPERQALVDAGVIINGLPLLYRSPSVPARELEAYYDTCVRGGWGSFVLPVRDQDDLATALKRKILLEIAGRMPAPTPRDAFFDRATCRYQPPHMGDWR